MTAISISRGRSPAGSGATALSRAATAWFTVAVIGQVAFAVYIAMFYGGAVARGDIGAWNAVMPHGLVAGDAAGNAALAAHLALAFVITVGGPLQLIPQVRAAAPRFHRLNGRVYILTAFVISLAGLYMVWTRGVLGGTVNAVAISLNGLLILGCAAMTWREAVGRRLDSHRRWALRLFLVVNGVWFFRVGMMLWVVINRGPVGVGKNLDGPFAVSLAYGQYIVPLLALELYLRARDRGGAAARYAVAAGLVACALATAGGIAAATAFMWLPRM